MSATGAGVQLESAAVGVKAGPRDGVEVHLLALTVGGDVWPPAVKTPFGRVGFRE